MVMTDAVTRLLPGVLGKDVSSHEESFSLISPSPNNLKTQQPKNLLEYPHYTRPEVYTPISYTKLGELTVPEILKQGHHAEIAKWRQQEALKRTKKRRPDLLN
jgi:tRNA (guanine37-N1)-methyltransferase